MHDAGGEPRDDDRLARRIGLVCDAEIRPALKKKLLADHAGDPDTVVLEELGVHRGEVRVDMAVRSHFAWPASTISSAGQC
jgi:hypothetical protein